MTLLYVQGDSRPAIRVSLEEAGAPIDVSGAGVIVRAYIRKVGDTAIAATLVGAKSTGRLTAVNPDTCAWTVNINAPYNVAGAGGIVLFSPLPTTFATAGVYECEYEIDYGSGIKQTVQKIDRINVRAQIG